MKHLIFIYFSTFISNCLYSQIKVEARAVNNDAVQFKNIVTGNKANDDLWEETENFVNGFAKVNANHLWTFVNKNGNAISNIRYESVRNFRNNVAAVKLNNKWGFIDENGKPIIPLEYDIVFDFKEVVTGVYKNNEWFLINKQAEIISKLDVDIFYGFENGIANILKNGRKGTINLKGQVLTLDPLPDSPNLKIPFKTNLVERLLGDACPANIGFEYGNFTNWNCFTGTVSAFGTTNTITVSPSPPTATRHVIYASSSGLDPYGLFPTKPQDGSNYNLRLGNPVNGAQAERISYQLTIPANSVDASITYRYAVVFQDPGHLVWEQPRFSAKLKDVSTNSYLPCASFEYISNSTLPGFYTSTVDNAVKCKAWSSVFINLSAYAGKTLILEFTTADCTKSGHWGYAYVDVGDCNLAATITYQCNPSVASVSAPGGFQYYNWWNDNYTTILATGQFATIAPIPPNNSYLHVEVVPFAGYGCKDTIDVLVNNTYATANAGPDKDMCAGAAAVTIGGLAVAGNVYSWQPASYLSNASVANPLANPPVSTTYYLTVTNPAFTCPNVDTVYIKVNPKPTPSFTTPASQCLSNNYFTFSNTTTGGYTYFWNFGDGTTSTLVNPTHTYGAAANYTVQLVVTSIDGCKDSVSSFVNVSQPPIPSFTLPANQCLSNNIFTFNNTSSGGSTYFWNFGDGTTSTLINPTHTYATASTYNVLLVVTNAGGCKDSIGNSLIVFPQPVPSFSPPANQCLANNNFTFNNTSSGAASYFWSFGDGTTSTLVNPTHTYTTASNYTVTLVVTNTQGCKDSVRNSFTVAAQPIPSFSTAANQCLSNNNFTFNNTSTGGVSYFWSFGDGTNSTLFNPTHTYTNASNYTVQLVVTNANGCKDSVSNFLNISQQPVSSFIVPASQCLLNNNFTFSNTSTGAATYFWSFGDGTTSTLINPSHTYASSSTYNVKLIVTNSNGCKDSVNSAVNVSPQPISSFILPTNQCLSTNNFTFNNTSTGAVNYFWSFGDGSTSTLFSPTHTYTTASTYTVQLLISNANGCKDSVRNFVNIFPQPISSFIVPASQCLLNNNFTFSNTSTAAATYFWNFGDGTTSTLLNPTHTYAASSTYTVKLVVTNANGCKDSVSNPVNVTPQPIPSFILPANQCLSNTNFTFINTSTGAVNYFWSFGDGTTSTLFNPTHTYTTAATYNVQLLVTNANGCKDSVHYTLSLFPQPISSFTASPNQCLTNNNFTFNNSSTGALTYFWSFGDGTTSTLLNPSHSYATASNYMVWLVITNANGCKDSVNNLLTVFPKPIASFNQPLDQCLNNNVFTFSNTSSSPAQYFWNFGDNTSSTQNNPSHTYNAAALYNVKLVVTDVNGCKDSLSHPVIINPHPTIVVQNSHTICKRDSVRLLVQGGQSYQWSPTQGLSCNNCPNPLASPASNITYTVTSANNAGCQSNAAVAITVHQPIKIKISPDIASCGKSTSTLLATGASSYTWSPNSGLTSTAISNPVASPDTTTNYMVIGKDAYNCFKDTGYVKISVYPFPAIELGADVTLATGTVYPIRPKIIAGPIVSWLWTPTTNLSCTNCPYPFATVKFDITYHALVKNKYGCTAMASFTIHTLCNGSQVFVPNAFTPDADGRNDILMVRSSGIDAIRSFKIYSRWGELIFEKYNFPPNNPSFGWDGKIKGKLGSAEVYVYVLEVTCDNNEHLAFKGNITILN